MNMIEKTEQIKNQVRKHGKYRLLALSTNLSYNWLNRFIYDKIPNPGVKNLSKLEDYFNDL